MDIVSPEMGIILIFGLIGCGIKVIDEVFDEGTFSRRAAFIIAPLIVILWAILSVYDAGSATILFAILASVLLSGKVDNFVFRTSAFILLILLLFVAKSNIILVPFLLLTVAGLIDEKGNDLADKKLINGILGFFFLHRFSMKFCIIALSLASFLPLFYVVAFLAFDSAYDSIGFVSPVVGEQSAVIKTRLLYLLSSV